MSQDIIDTEGVIQDVRSAEKIAVEINTIKRQTQKVMLSASIEIGKRLSEAKQLVTHGHWSEWLQQNVSYSDRTAQNLIKIFEQFGDQFGAKEMDSLFSSGQSNAFAELSYTQAVALLSIPSIPEREEFVKEHPVTAMSTRELQDAIKCRNEAEKQLKKKERQIADMEQREQQLQTDLEEARQDITLAKNEQETSALAAQEAQTLLQKKEAELSRLREDLDHATVAAIDPERETHIRKLEAEIDRLQKDADADQDRRVFTIQLEMVQSSFNRMLNNISAIQDNTKREKFRGAARKLLQRLGELV